MKRVGRKLKNRQGITLIELLLTIAILYLIAILAVCGIKAVKRDLKAMELQYDAHRLKEHFLESITEELRYEGKSEIEETINRFTGQAEEIDSLGAPDSPQLAEYSGLRVCPLRESIPILQWEEENSCVIISFGICDSAGQVLESVEGFRIRSFNGAGGAAIPAASSETALQK